MADKVRRAVVTAVVAILLVVPSTSASASLGRGLQYIIAGVLEIPRSTLAGTFGGFPILGTVFGALGGVLRGAAMVTRGTLELIPVAAKLAPLIPVLL
jgi:hypothetical protein